MWFGAPEGMNGHSGEDDLHSLAEVSWRRRLSQGRLGLFLEPGCVGRGWVPFGTEALTGQENHSTSQLIYILIVGGK